MSKQKLEIQIKPVSELAAESHLNEELTTMIDNIFGAGESRHKIKHIVLINPPDINSERFSAESAKIKRYKNYEPYGLGVLAANCEANGIKCSIVNLNNDVLKSANEDGDKFDFTHTWQNSLKKILSESPVKPDLIGITCMFSQTHQSLIDVSAYLKKNTDIPVALGGVHITNSILSENIRSKFVGDFLGVNLFFLYESDVSFVNFIKFVNRETDVSSLGTTLLRYPGVEDVLYNKVQRPIGAELDIYPLHGLMQPEELSQWGKVGAYWWMKDKGSRFATVLSNRGCRAQCTFCSVRNFNGVSVRRRSATSVVDELKRLHFDHGVNHVMWLDDDLLYNTKNTMELFNEIAKANLDLTWDASNGVIAAAITDEIADAASRSGCIGMSIGMESGNKEILRSIKKPGVPKNFLKAAEILKKYPNIYSQVFLIIGFPNETFSQIKDTADISMEMAMDWSGVSTLQPLPNTPIFDEMVLDGQIDPAEFDKVRYSGGAYGKNAEDKSKGCLDPMSQDFKNLFSEVKMDAIPNQKQLSIVWAYLSYYLNYATIPNIKSKFKLTQLYKNLTYVTDIVAKNDAFGIYMRIDILSRYPSIDENCDVDTLRERLKKVVTGDSLWKDRFEDFSLSY